MTVRSLADQEVQGASSKEINSHVVCKKVTKGTGMSLSGLQVVSNSRIIVTIITTVYNFLEHGTHSSFSAFDLGFGEDLWAHSANGGTKTVQKMVKSRWSCMLGEKTKPQSLGNLLLDKSPANQQSINFGLFKFVYLF